LVIFYLFIVIVCALDIRNRWPLLFAAAAAVVVVVVVVVVHFYLVRVQLSYHK
jgi:hypothetical protein